MADLDGGELERTALFRSELRRFLHRTELLAAEAGLTPQRYDLLLQLKAAGSSTVTELAELLHLRQTAVTELVKRAQEAGLVRRRRSSDDGRVFVLELTQLGEKRLLQVYDALRRERSALLSAFEELDASFRASTRS